MLRSLYSGISGMKANQIKLDVIGNNVANVGTTAFKSGRARFKDMLSQNMTPAMAPSINTGGINPSQVGLGVRVAGIDTLVTQGMMQPTSNNLDFAIDGEGFFIVARGVADYNPGKSINIDEANHVIKNTNNIETMYTRDGSFTLDESGNLITGDGYRVMGYSVTSASDPGKVQSLNPGGVVRYVDANKTDLQAVGAAGDVYMVPLKIPEKIVESVTDPVSGVTTDKEIRVKSFSIEKNGLIKGVLEDGRVTVLGQMASASFRNPAGLSKLGSNLYQVSANSGEPVIKSGIGSASDNTKGYGDILQGLLEMSNVDLAEQFTEMIVTSRAFQASAKVISTGDEILQDILNIKR